MLSREDGQFIFLKGKVVQGNDKNFVEADLVSTQVRMVTVKKISGGDAIQEQSVPIFHPKYGTAYARVFEDAGKDFVRKEFEEELSFSECDLENNFPVFENFPCPTWEAHAFGKGFAMHIAKHEALKGEKGYPYGGCKGTH